MQRELGHWLQPYLSAVQALPDTKDNLILTDVIPGLGVIIAATLFLSPLSAIRKAVAEGHLGELNSVVYPLILANCAGWVSYGLLTHDKYVLLANEGGLLLGIYYTFAVFGLSGPKGQTQLLRMVLAFTVLVTGVAMGLCIASPAYSTQKFAWGLTCNAILLCYYVAPLSTLAKVFTTRSSSSLHWPLALMNVINGSLWAAYGVAVHDYFLWVPNAIGALLGLLQLTLCLIFPRLAGRIGRTPATSPNPKGHDLDNVPSGELNLLDNAIPLGEEDVDASDVSLRAQSSSSQLGLQGAKQRSAPGTSVPPV